MLYFTYVDVCPSCKALMQDLLLYYRTGDVYPYFVSIRSVPYPDDPVKQKEALLNFDFSMSVMSAPSVDGSETPTLYTPTSYIILKRPIVYAKEYVFHPASLNVAFKRIKRRPPLSYSPIDDRFEAEKMKIATALALRHGSNSP